MTLQQRHFLFPLLVIIINKGLGTYGRLLPRLIDIYFDRNEGEDPMRVYSCLQSTTFE